MLNQSVSRSHSVLKRQNVECTWRAKVHTGRNELQHERAYWYCFPSLTYRPMKVLPRFKLSYTLAGHKKGINSLSISHDGMYLLSGGEWSANVSLFGVNPVLGQDGNVLVWRLSPSSRSPLQIISCVIHGQISVVMWLTSPHYQTRSAWQHAFAFACVDGSVHIYSHEVGLHDLFMST